MSDDTQAAPIDAGAPFVGSPSVTQYTVVPEPTTVMGNYTHNGPPTLDAEKVEVDMITLEEFVTMAETFKALEAARLDLVRIVDMVRNADPSDIHLSIGNSALQTDKSFVVAMYEDMLHVATLHVEDYRKRIARHHVKV